MRNDPQIKLFLLLFKSETKILERAQALKGVWVIQV